MSRTDTSRYYSIIFHFFVSDKITGKGEENCLFHLLDFFPRNIFCRLFLTDKLLLDKKPLSPISRQLKREVLFLQAIKSKLFLPAVFMYEIRRWVVVTPPACILYMYSFPPFPVETD